MTPPNTASAQQLPQPTASVQVALPEGYRVQELLALHGRDAQQLAERVELHVDDGLEGQTIHKGLTWAGRPALLQLRLGHEHAQARLWLDPLPEAAQAGRQKVPQATKVPAQPATSAALQSMLERMLGLNEGIAAFEQACLRHAQLGPLLRQQSGLRVPNCSTPFEALVWALTGQQISVQAAVALRRRLIAAIGLRHGSGLLCFPDAAALAALTPEQWREAGFSQSKMATLQRICEAVLAGNLPLDDWLEHQPLHAEAVSEALTAIKGVGSWTAHYVLLRGYGWTDGSLHGDAAVRRALARLLGQDRLSAAETQDWLEQFAPWRALVAAHLWASLALTA